MLKMPARKMVIDYMFLKSNNYNKTTGNWEKCSTCQLIKKNS